MIFDRGGRASEDALSTGDTVGDRYRIEALLGRGATGQVFAASHEITGRAVAIKWLRHDLAASEHLVTRFLREARTASAIDHPNVVSVLDAGRDRGTLYLVMERLRGKTLTKFFERGPHQSDLVIATMMPALRGVSAAHDLGVVHRDLKPDNIFLPAASAGWMTGAKVLDFGISKLKQPADGRELTHDGVYLGSPLYMAPEQIATPTRVDARADVYSIAVMLYEGLSGHVPFEADNLTDLFRRAMNEVPPPLRKYRPDVPSLLEHIVLAAMSRDRRERPPSVRALALSLEPFAGKTRFEIRSSDAIAIASSPPESAHTLIADVPKIPDEPGDMRATVPPPPRSNEVTDPSIPIATHAPEPYQPRISTLRPDAPPSAIWFGIAAVATAGAFVLGLAIGMLAT